jgi:hypothetical protein
VVPVGAIAPTAFFIPAPKVQNATRKKHGCSIEAAAIVTAAERSGRSTRRSRGAAGDSGGSAQKEAAAIAVVV